MNMPTLLAMILLIPAGSQALAQDSGNPLAKKSNPLAAGNPLANKPVRPRFESGWAAS